MRRTNFLIMLLVFTSHLNLSAKEPPPLDKVDVVEELNAMRKLDFELLALLLMAKQLNVNPGDVFKSKKKLNEEFGDVFALVHHRRMQGDYLAEATIRRLSEAAEKFTEDNQGAYPSSNEDLEGENRPYLQIQYCDKVLSGYKYGCEFSNDGYKFIATPEKTGETGFKTYTIVTGGIFSEREGGETVDFKQWEYYPDSEK